MSIVAASSLSSAEMLLLGNNVLPHVKQTRPPAVSRSPALHDEHVDRLYRRAATSRMDRLWRRNATA